MLAEVSPLVLCCSMVTFCILLHAMTRTNCCGCGQRQRMDCEEDDSGVPPRRHLCCLPCAIAGRGIGAPVCLLRRCARAPVC